MCRNIFRVKGFDRRCSVNHQKVFSYTNNMTPAQELESQNATLLQKLDETAFKVSIFAAE